MKQFSTIFSFELRNYLKNKVFVGTTLFLCIVICAVMFIPRIAEAFSEGEGPSATVDVTDIGDIPDISDGVVADGREVMLIFAPEETKESVVGAFREVFPGYFVAAAPDDSAGAVEEIASGRASCAFVFDSLRHFTYYVKNLSLYDQNEQIAAEAMLGVFRMNEMVGAGISLEDAQRIFSTEIEHETVNLGVDQAQNFFYTYIMIFALYMVILLYGQMIATGVATEKSSRAMELLVTSANPTAMMFAKVIASCLAGLLQLVCVFGSALLFYNLNRGYWADIPVVGSIFDIPPSLLVYMLLFFILGFLVYAFMYGAVGSTVSKLEDINTAVMPVTLIFIAAFFVVMFSLTSSSVDNFVLKVCSFIPFTSPMSMFTRIAMSNVPGWQIALSVGILAASVAVIGVISARIYRVGVLLYGTKPNIISIIKTVFRG